MSTILTIDIPQAIKNIELQLSQDDEAIFYTHRISDEQLQLLKLSLDDLGYQYTDNDNVIKRWTYLLITHPGIVKDTKRKYINAHTLSKFVSMYDVKVHSYYSFEMIYHQYKETLNELQGILIGAAMRGAKSILIDSINHPEWNIPLDLLVRALNLKGFTVKTTIRNANATSYTIKINWAWSTKSDLITYIKRV